MFYLHSAVHYFHFGYVVRGYKRGSKCNDLRRDRKSRKANEQVYNKDEGTSGSAIKLKSNKARRENEGMCYSKLERGSGGQRRGTILKRSLKKRKRFEKSDGRKDGPPVVTIKAKYSGNIIQLVTPYRGVVFGGIQVIHGLTSYV